MIPEIALTSFLLLSTFKEYLLQNKTEYSIIQLDIVVPIAVAENQMFIKANKMRDLQACTPKQFEKVF